MHRSFISTLARALAPAARNSLRIPLSRALYNNPSCRAVSITHKLQYSFTSTSNPSEVALLEEVEAKVFQVLKTAAKCKVDKLDRKATFEELGFDSLDSVELVVAMEEFFGFDISNDEAEKINSVESAINVFFKYMNDKVANKLAQPADSDVKKQ